MLKTDWVAVFIATFGVAVIVWHGWNSRKADPVMKKIIYGLLGLIGLLWLMMTILLVGGNAGV
jgi:ABC-type nickel/cobalt efflux system permease component RcnA